MKKIFISYSHEPDKYKKLTQRLADKLIGLGIPVVIDKYELRYGHDIDQFMKDITNTEIYSHILVICTTEYKTRADLVKGNVGKEAVHLRNLINNDPYQERVIPVIVEVSECPKALLPNFFPDNTYYSDLSNEINFDGNESKMLTNHIQGIHPLKPKQSELDTLISYSLGEYPGLPKELIGINKNIYDKLIYDYCRDSYDKDVRTRSLVEFEQRNRINLRKFILICSISQIICLIQSLS